MRAIFLMKSALIITMAIGVTSIACECDQLNKDIKEAIQNANYNMAVDLLINASAPCKERQMPQYLYFATISANAEMFKYIDRWVLNYQYFNDLNLSDRLGQYCLSRNNMDCLKEIERRAFEKDIIINTLIAKAISAKRYQEIIAMSENEKLSVPSTELMLAYFGVGNVSRAKEVAEYILANGGHMLGAADKELSKLLANHVLGKVKASPTEIMILSKGMVGLEANYNHYLAIINKGAQSN